MRRLISTVTLFAYLFILNSEAQVISYIIPDIGSPGMNIYVEMIAPVGSFGSFGSDGFYMNNPGDAVRVVTERTDDAKKLVFGPISVSWNGRLLSTQVFILPDVNPNSDYWANLQTEFIIPFHIVVNNQVTNTEYFYIVKPFAFGDKSGSPERTLGSGSLGTRSKRGAMVVDFMTLANGIYSISLNDCDPGNNGNQAYLPFIILSKGKVTGGTISANANGKHAGPGGGGGGGNFCDVSTGEDGGNGFTGGGRGGRNMSGDNAFKNYGTGTGSSGYSLNGIAPGTADWYEAAGGGTGNPFGFSGYGCGDGNGCDPPGGFGGGSGYRQSRTGGSGGYATAGRSISSQNGGKVNGNDFIVPFGGGSGGASGNPNWPISCGGKGGGAGGAVMVYGESVEGLNITATGAVGTTGDNNCGDGGSGSGGAAYISAKLTAINSFLNVAGGSNGGGFGRARVEAATTNITATNGASFFRGLTTDTSKNPQPDFTLTGSRDASMNIEVYLKPFSGNWLKLSGIQYNNNLWSLPVSLTSYGDSIYFIAAVQNAGANIDDRYAYKPQYIMAQAAANILKVPSYPKIEGDSLVEFLLVDCPVSIMDTVKTAVIRNTGTGNLDLEFGYASFVDGTKGFELVSPTKLYKVKPKDSVTVTIKFNYRKGMRGVYIDTLIILHNDNTTGSNPWKIICRAVVDSITFKLYEINLVKQLKSIDFGKVCIGNSKQVDFAVKNTSQVNLNFMNPQVIDLNNYKGYFFGDSPTILNDTGTFRAEFTPTVVGVIASKLYIRALECQDIVDSVDLTGEGVKSDLKFISNYFIDSSRVDQKDTFEIELRNDGTGDVVVRSVPALNPPFRVLDTTPVLPATLQAGEVMKIRIEFAPTTETMSNDIVKILTDSQGSFCADSAKLNISGFGYRTAMKYGPDTIDFGTHPWCHRPLKDTIVTIFNLPSSSGPLRIGNSYITGDPLFGIAQDHKKGSLQPGEQDTIFLYFSRDNNPNLGQKTGMLHVPTDDAHELEIRVVLLGKHEGAAVDIEPFNRTLDFGDVPINVPSDLFVKLTNISESVQRAKRSVGLWNKLPDFTYIVRGNLDARDSIMNVTVTFKPSGAGLFIDTLLLVYYEPCQFDTQYVFLRGNGIKLRPRFTSSVFFPVVSKCDSIIDSVVIDNNINNIDTLWVESMSITGANAGLFRFADVIPPVFPVKVPPNSKPFIRKIAFVPGNTADGVKQATVETVINYNGPDTLSTDVSGEKQIFYTTSPLVINFGNVIINTTSVKPINITNTGPVQIAINARFPLKNYELDFTFNPDPRYASYPINQGNTQGINVTFAPKLQQLYLDTVRFRMFTNCYDTTEVVLIGIGIPPRNVRLWIPDTTVTPDIENFSLPVYAMIDNINDVLSGATLNASFIFNESLFFPTGLTGGGTIIRNSSAGSMRTIDIQLNNLNINGTTTKITEITGTTLLGDNDTTDINWAGYSWTNAGIIGKTDTIPGKMRTKICREAGKRLVKQTYKNSITIIPNPVSNEFTVELTLLENGTHSLELVNSQGKYFELERWNNDGKSGNIYSFTFNSSGFSSGLYYLLLKTPTRSVEEKVYILK